jgi:hypothetical protein
MTPTTPTPMKLKKKPKLPPVVPVWQEWYFQPGYSETDKAALADNVDAALTVWIKSSYSKIATIFANEPNRKSAGEFHMAWCDRNGESVLINGETVWILTALMCRRGMVEPYQCMVYMGSKPFIEKIRQGMIAQINQQFSQPGVEGEMIEEDLSDHIGPRLIDSERAFNYSPPPGTKL